MFVLMFMFMMSIRVNNMLMFTMSTFILKYNVAVDVDVEDQFHVHDHEIVCS